MNKVLWHGVLADLSRLDAVRISGRSPSGNEKWIEPIVNTDVPRGHRLRLSIVLEPIAEFACVCGNPSCTINFNYIAEEQQLVEARNGLVDKLYRSASALEICAAIEDLVSARVARALRVHCDADHDDE